MVPPLRSFIAVCSVIDDGTVYRKYESSGRIPTGGELAV
jgi:hypothetical protein